MQEKVTIENRLNRSVIASAIEGNGVQLFEGAWYFQPTAVDMKDLIVSERIYICPYKGRCYWIDLKTADSVIQNVGFTYFEVNPGYEFIHNHIGFYAGERDGTVEKIIPLEQPQS